MALDLGTTVSVLKDTNIEATKVSAQIVAGKIINDKLVEIVGPNLPLMIRSYASTELGKAVLANAVAGVIINTMPTNDKAILAANSMVSAANLSLMESFNLDEMFNNLVDGVNFGSIAPVGSVGRVDAD